MDGLDEEKLVDPGVIGRPGERRGYQSIRDTSDSLGREEVPWIGAGLYMCRGVASHRRGVLLWKIPAIHLKPLLPSPCLSHPQ